MSRWALVTDRWQSAHDKTRVSSINKRRVTPVPRSARRYRRDRNLGARPERELPSRCRTRRCSWGAATSLLSLGVACLAQEPSPCTSGRCPLGCRRIGWDCRPTSPASRARDPPITETPHGIDPDSPHPSGPVSTRAFRRGRSIDSSPMGGGSLRPSQRSDPAHPDFSRTNDAASGTPHDDAFPDDLVLPDTRACALAISWRTSTTLARGLGVLPRGQSRLDRVAV